MYFTVRWFSRSYHFLELRLTVGVCAMDFWESLVMLIKILCRVFDSALVESSLLI